MSRESVSIEIILASLNDLEIFTCDIGNAYIDEKYIEKIWTEAGTESGTEKGMVTIITRALYGIKISGDSCKEKISETLMPLGYKSYKADADVWTKQMDTLIISTCYVMLITCSTYVSSQRKTWMSLI